MTFLHDLWKSADRLSDAITLANWGIAASLLFGFLFTAFVIIAGNRKDELNEALSKAQDLRISEAQRGAAEATATAKGFESKIAESDARTKAAEAQVVSAMARSDEAVAQVKTADARIAEAQRDAARANATAEQERLARLQLEARLADRTLSAAQQTALVSQLSATPGTIVDVMTWGDSPEIQIISGILLDCMRRAGWTVLSGQAGGGGGAVRGILIGTRSDAGPDVRRAADAFTAALRSFGIASGPWPFDQLQPPMIRFNTSFSGNAPLRIFIGSKP